MKRTLVFLLLNFSALALGSYLMGEGPTGPWYASLNKAPWTPPGWVFGAAWTTIMIAFAFFMSTWQGTSTRPKRVTLLYAVHLVLNISWNPLFFNLNWLAIALVEILLLLALVIYIGLLGKKESGQISLLVLPYIAWLSIASTLNAYALLYN